MMKLFKNMLKGLVAVLLLSIGTASFAMSDDPEDEIRLVAADRTVATITRKIAYHSVTLRDLLRDAHPDNSNSIIHAYTIPLPNIPTGALLIKIVGLMQTLDGKGILWNEVKKGNDAATKAQESRELWAKAQELYPQVSEQLKSVEESINLFIAFNYLDVPILLRVMALRISEKLTKALLGVTVPYIDAIAYGPRNERAAKLKELVNKGSNYAKFGLIHLDLFQILAQAMEPHSLGFFNNSKYNLKVEVNYTDGSTPYISEVKPGVRTSLAVLDMSKIKEIKITSLGSVALTNKVWTYSRADLLKRWAAADKKPVQTRMMLVVTTSGPLGTGFLVDLKVIPEVPEKK